MPRWKSLEAAQTLWLDPLSAANTLVMTGDAITAHNTDCDAAIKSLCAVPKRARVRT